jgi:hypothetical protein
LAQRKLNDLRLKAAFRQRYASRVRQERCDPCEIVTSEYEFTLHDHILPSCNARCAGHAATCSISGK